MKKKIFSIIIVFLIILALGFLPIWSKSLMLGGEIKINTWQKLFMKID